MSRIRVYKNTRLGAAEIYPVYELDFSKLSALTGYTQQYSDDNVGSGVNKYRQWVCINNTVDTGIAGSIPRQESQSGNIIPFWHRYNNVINNRYYLDQENLGSFAGIQQGVRPDDWGTNPNYVILSNETLTGINNFPGASGTTSVPINYPDLQWTTDTWNHQTAYYEDTKRTQLRKFYTETGRSFSVAKATYWNSNRYCGRAYCVGCFPTTSSNSYAGYNYTDENNSTYNRNYKLFYTYGITNIPNDADYYWDYWTGMTNIQMVFVHYVENGTTDFYGIALIQMNNLTEESEPVAIAVSAFDKDWWGESSIIAGGGGEGDWSRNGPPSYVQGGQGSFQAPSDNHGDADGTTAKTIAADWSGKHSPFDQGYNKYLLSSPDATAFKEMVDNLVDPDVWQGFDNKYYNPIDSIITCSMIPAYLAPSGSAIGASSVIKASKLNLTTSTVPTFNIWNKAIHIGSVDIRPYCDGFPDFDNTAIYINLPYVGVKQLDINACMDGILSVDYLIDYLTQDITAQIWVRDKFGNYNIRYEYKGNCGRQVPLTQIVPRSTQIVEGVRQAFIPLAAGLAVGGVAGLAVGAGAAVVKGAGKIFTSQSFTGAAFKEGFSSGFSNTFPKALNGTGITMGVSSAAQSAFNASQQMTSSNANGGAVSSPVNTQCYILITRPMWSAPEEYGKQFGYPSDISGTINMSDTEAGDPFTNFLSVRSILLENIPCTVEERNEIDTLMKAGVYVSND